MVQRCEVKIDFQRVEANSWFSIEKVFLPSQITESAADRDTELPVELEPLWANDLAASAALPPESVCSPRIQLRMLEPYQPHHSINVLPSLTLIGFGSIMQQDFTWLHNTDSSTAAVAHFWRSGAHIWSSGRSFTLHVVDLNGHISLEAEVNLNNRETILETSLHLPPYSRVSISEYANILPPIVLPTSLLLISELKDSLQHEGWTCSCSGDLGCIFPSWWPEKSPSWWWW